MSEPNSIQGLVHRARTAQKAVEGYSQQQIDDLCRSVAWQMYEDGNIRLLAQTAADETGMGNVRDKITKHKNKVLGVIADVRNKKSVGLIEQDEQKQIYKYAKPVGVVGALTPVTNPTATPASNAVSILKGGNAVIFAPHPKAKKSTALAVQLMRQGLARVGAPVDLVQVIAEPSVELTGELMCSVDLVVATGGAAMVKAAYSSGTPAYGVGPGNSVQIIAEDADVADAAAKITTSKSFDYATSCSSENALIVHRTVLNVLLEEFKKQGGYLCDENQRAALATHMWKPNKKGMPALNPDITAKSAPVIAKGAGFTVPEDTTILLVTGSLPIAEDPFAKEKLSPVLTLYPCDSFEEGVSLLAELTDNCGTGHSCGIHSFNPDYIDTLGRSMRSSRIIVRQPQAAANGGAFFNGMPSTTTLGCGTWGGNITTENITYKHFLNITWLSLPLADWRPADEEIWGDFWERYGR